MASDLGWDARSVDLIRLAAPMHDVGKIGIADSILLKPGRLTREEFDIIKTHTTIGAKILGGSDVPLLRLAKEIALSHHERWDGSGYPQGLVTDSIPQSARIVSVADVYDALVNDRVYRPAFPEEEALTIMDEQRGRYFDPRVFDSFKDMLPELRRIGEAVKEGGVPG
jgi:putative two-component system response regulator